MRHATANGKRIVSVITGLAQKSGDSATFTDRIFCAKRYLRLGFFLGSLGLISILLLSVQFPADASRGTAVKRRDTQKNRPDSSLFETPGLRTSTDSDEAVRPRLREAFGNLPLGFEANRGQTDSRVKYLSRGGGYELFLTSREAVMLLRNEGSSDRGQDLPNRNKQAPAPGSQLPTSSVLRMQFVGANSRAEIVGEGELPGKVNYFIGNNPAKWRTGISTYSRVRYRGIYSGIDLVYYGNQRQLEYDFVVGPGANPKDIQLSIAGADDCRVDVATGDLVLRVAGREVRQLRPVAYQEANGEGREINVRYALFSIDASIRNPQSGIRNQFVRFEVADYDRSKPLVIDPVLIYSTYLGGSSADSGTGIGLDSSGNAYVAGSTSSSNFPTLNSIQSFTGQRSGFITKINPTGTALVYSTYLGGTGNGNTTDFYDIAVDSAGNAYATGFTFATDYPTTANGLLPTKPVNSSQSTAVVTKLNSGGTLAYSTYLGGSQFSRAFGIATDGAGNAYVVGQPGSPPTGFPITASAFNSTEPSTGYLTKLNTNASGQASLAYSTFLGPAFGASTPTAITVDAAGNAYLAGNATSNSNNTGFTTPGAFQTTYAGGVRDVFLAKFNTSASGNAARVYCTYLGGSGDDTSANGIFTVDSSKIAIDAAGNAYITGTTSSTNFPVHNPYQATKGSAVTNAFLTKLNSTGSALVYSTYFGGSSPTNRNDVGLGVAVNVVGNAYITGLASTTDFPTQNPIVPVQATGDIFVAKFTPAGNALVYSPRMSGSTQQAWGHAVALDGAGNAFVTGNTRTGLPTTTGAFQTTFGARDDACISEIASPTITGLVVDKCNTPSASASGILCAV